MASDDSPSSITLWLDRLQAGEPEALNELLRHGQDRLKLLTRQMLRRFPNVRRWEDTSDVFQNVLIRLDRALRVVPVETSGAFLRLTACQIRRELIDLSRQRHMAGAFADPGDDGSGPNPVGDKSDSTNDPYNLALWEEVHSRIDGLPDEDQQLFDLLYYQGLAQTEAAAVLGVSLRTLRRKWQVARARLMLALGNEVPF